MKKIALVLMVVCMAFGMCACGDVGEEIDKTLGDLVSGDKTLEDVGKDIEDKVAGAVDDAIDDAADKAKDAAGNLIDDLPDLIQDKAGEIVDDAIDKAADSAKEFNGKVYETGTSLKDIDQSKIVDELAGDYFVSVIKSENRDEVIVDVYNFVNSRVYENGFLSVQAMVSKYSAEDEELLKAVVQFTDNVDSVYNLDKTMNQYDYEDLPGVKEAWDKLYVVLKENRDTLIGFRTVQELRERAVAIDTLSLSEGILEYSKVIGTYKEPEEEE